MIIQYTLVLVYMSLISLSTYPPENVSVVFSQSDGSCLARLNEATWDSVPVDSFDGHFPEVAILQWTEV